MKIEKFPFCCVVCRYVWCMCLVSMITEKSNNNHPSPTHKSTTSTTFDICHLPNAPKTMAQKTLDEYILFLLPLLLYLVCTRVARKSEIEYMKLHRFYHAFAHNEPCTRVYRCFIFKSFCPIYLFI